MGKRKNIEYDFDRAKEEYRYFCENEDHDIQIFAMPWFLDAVCDSVDDWKVIVYKENNKVIAAFPFEYKKRKMGMWHISNPWQAARLGVWIDYKGKDKKNSTKEDFENKVCQHIIDNLPYYDKFNIMFDSRFVNWQPFYNNGFEQTTNYSYLYNPSEIEDVKEMSNINKIKRREIRNFTSNNIRIIEDFEEYWDFYCNISYKERQRNISYTKEKMEKLHNVICANSAGKIYGYYDEKGSLVGVIYNFFDKRRSYKMYGTFIKNGKVTTQAHLTYYGVIEMLELNKSYDFEGSMIKGVANFNREMGATKEPYFVISKFSSKYNTLESIRTFKNSLIKWIRGV